MDKRQLWQSEIDEAKKVYGNSIDYSKVFFAPHDGGAMTFAYYDFKAGWIYVIWWNNDVYTKGAMFDAQVTRTFIHEMTHVWQGQHNTYPREYMLRSGLSQAKGVWDDAWAKGAKEVIKRVREKGPVGAWHEFRSRTYAFSMNQMGVNNFGDFNVEQQASIVESWYAPTAQPNYLGENIPGGNMSTSDVRYPYISCNILANAPSAQYIPLKPSSSGAAQTAKGFDPKIKAIQDILVSLRYLDPRFADGYMGKNTREAVRGFQRNNGLKPDGDIGGPNSETRKKLGVR